MIATIIIASVLFCSIGFIIYRQVKAYRNGESNCGCGCAGCKSKCHMNTQELKK